MTPEVVPVLRVTAGNWDDAKYTEFFHTKADALTVHNRQGSNFRLPTVIILGNSEALGLTFTRCSRHVADHLLYFVSFS